MEIKKFSDIDNREYRSQIAEVYALTNDKNKVPGLSLIHIYFRKLTLKTLSQINHIYLDSLQKHN